MTEDVTSLDLDTLNGVLKEKYSAILGEMTGVLEKNGIKGYQVLEFKLQSTLPSPISSTTSSPSIIFWCGICGGVFQCRLSPCPSPNERPLSMAIAVGAIIGAAGALVGWLISYYVSELLGNIFLGGAVGVGFALSMWGAGNHIQTKEK